MIESSLSLVTPPTELAVSVGAARAHARLNESTPEQGDVELKLRAAIDDRESFVRRQFLTATYELALSGWPCDGVIRLPRPPLVSVSSIKYDDENGTEQTWAADNYRVVTRSGPRARHGIVELAYGKTFPLIRASANAVRVSFVCGYGADEASVPAVFRQAVLLVFGDMYAHREDAPEASAAIRAANRLCWPYRSFMPVNR